MENLHDLLSEFFERQNHIAKVREEARKMIEMMMDFERLESFEKQMDEHLGEPDEINTFSDGILCYEQRIWHTETGDIIKVSVSDTASDIPSAKTSEKPLHTQLKEAIAAEDYEKAILIRDRMRESK